MRPAPGIPPHVHAGSRTPAFCWIVAACLAPAAGWGVLSYGRSAAVVLAVAVGAALAVELAAAGMRRRFTLDDGSAFLTGLLVGLSLPPAAPWYVAAAASGFAIAVVKQGFGGLGRNWMNPALAGRAFAALSWPGAMTAWLPTRFTGPDAVAAATPLAAAGAASGPGRATFAALASAGGPFSRADDAAVSWLNAHVLSPLGAAAPRGLLDLLAGLRAGAIGEASVLLLLAGAAVLLWRRIIRWEIPAALFGTFALFTGVLGGLPGGLGLFRGGVVFPLLTGGIVLAGFFMATDPVTSPMSRWGRVAYGALAGAFTWLLRVFGGAPEGVGLALLVANCFAPLLDRGTRPRRPA
jgi:Na+-translocating ferredoxin:NAD+ oxidoreductase subunit D